jgi:hypothetical protein
MIRKCTYFLLYCIHCSLSAIETTDVVTKTPGLVAFWDFVKREPDKLCRFTAHVPSGEISDYPLDAVNYINLNWNAGRQATYADFPQLGRGPFGNAIRFKQENDINFRPLLCVAHEQLHDKPLDIKGSDKSVTLIVWAIRESGNHALAGIWHEGTDLKDLTNSNNIKSEPGQRQYALFAGLKHPGTACGHVSDNGAGSFMNKYALHKSHTSQLSPETPAPVTTDLLDKSWQCFAMSFNHETDEITSWLNGVPSEKWIDNLNQDEMTKSAYNAYMQGYFAKLPGKQEGEDEAFPKEQYYNPPEGAPLSVKVLEDSALRRIEMHQHRFTKIKVTIQNGKEVRRDLMGIRENPWWFPHSIYSPKDSQSGGPFTIGRVIHSARSVGFTGWIGGVAVFDRALTAKEMVNLANLRNAKPTTTSLPQTLPEK